jgi:hypothetical protein
MNYFFTHQQTVPFKGFVKIPLGFCSSHDPVSQASMVRLRELTSALLEMPYFLVPNHGSDINCSESF